MRIIPVVLSQASRVIGFDLVEPYVSYAIAACLDVLLA
jgi:hypothetical protein